MDVFRELRSSGQFVEKTKKGFALRVPNFGYLSFDPEVIHIYMDKQTDRTTNIRTNIYETQRFRGGKK